MAMEKKGQQDAVSRRNFMKKGATAAGAAAGMAGVKTASASSIPTSILPGSVLGANEIIRTGHIGLGGMGRADLGFVMRRKDMLPVALCDLWPANLARGMKMANYKNKEATEHKDFREVIDNKDVDAVVIATPDHWHALCTMYAADAGKDVYCEKPAATTIAEGKAMVENVRKNNIVFQAGNMQRSGKHFQKAVELVRGGHIGKVARVETYIHDDSNIDGIGMGDDDLAKYAAKGCDWDFHQGWCEHKPFNTNRWIYNFRWFLDYSGGKITDWGAHLIDIALWGMGGLDQDPLSVTCEGNKFVLNDNRTTPDTLEVLWQFEDYVLSFGNRVYNQYLPEGYQGHGILFHGTLGTLRVDRGGYQVYSVANNDGCEELTGAIEEELNPPHWQNFADCIRDRKDPICTVEVIEHTSKVCHMGTTSYVVGEKLGWDKGTQKFTNDNAEKAKEANDFAYRPYQNGWSLEAPYKA